MITSIFKREITTDDLGQKAMFPAMQSDVDKFNRIEGGEVLNVKITED